MAVDNQPTVIRVVPMYAPDELIVPAGPKLTYRGGQLLTNVEVFTVFWGSDWQQAAQTRMVDRLNGFFDAILVSPLIDQLSEYSVPGKTIGHGKRSGSAIVTSPPIAQSVTDAGVQQLIQQEVSANSAFPQPGPNVLYFLFLQPGVAVSLQGSQSCTSFCGYHSDINGQTFYAVMPYAGCPGCLGSMQALDALTSTSSHELCEAITDAVPGSGWYDDQNGEIGDICAWKTKQMAGYTVQLEWSNQHNACI